MPVVPKPVRSATSRSDGAMSRDPVTDAGKAASASNLIPAARLEVDSLSAQHLASHLEPMLADWLPANDCEERLVHDLAITALKLSLLDALELKALDAAIDGTGIGYPALASLARYRHALRREQEETRSRLTAVQEDRWTMEDTAAEAQLAEAEAKAAAARSRMNEPERRGSSVHSIRYH